jgi:rRNA processing protein Krr1/Pno1
MKKGIIKGFADRQRALCELKNVEDVFVVNGFERQKVREYMKEDKRERNESKEQEYRGMIIVPYILGLSEQLKRLASKHSFWTTFKPGNKIKELKARAQQLLGEKHKSVVYEISGKCKKAVYIGETSRLFKVRKKEHEAK